jgi:hypothetical protein
MPAPALQGVAGPSESSTQADARLAQSVTNGVNGDHVQPLKYANDTVKENYLFAGGRGKRGERKFRVVCVGAGAAGIYVGIQVRRRIV